jgi:hypothetical protein
MDKQLKGLIYKYKNHIAHYSEQKTYTYICPPDFKPDDLVIDKIIRTMDKLARLLFKYFIGKDKLYNSLSNGDIKFKLNKMKLFLNNYQYLKNVKIVYYDLNINKIITYYY